MRNIIKTLRAEFAPVCVHAHCDIPCGIYDPAGAVTAAKIGGVLFPSQIPDLDAFKITSGTLDDARLSASVALLNRSPQTFTGTNNFAQRVGIGTGTPEVNSKPAGVGRSAAVAAATSAAGSRQYSNGCLVFMVFPFFPQGCITWR